VFRWLFRRTKAREATPQDVVDALQGLSRRLQALEERQDFLEGAHRRMRGYVYAKKGAVLDTFSDAPQPRDRKAFLQSESKKRRLTKPELRELAGLAPLGSSPPPAAEGQHHE